MTAADYEAHALELGVAKARAFTGAWNRVRLFIAPAGGGQPSKTLKEQLSHHLDQRRVMTTIVELHDPEYVKVDIIIAELTVEPTYFNEQVQHAADQALRALFAFDNVDFGQVFYLSKLYEKVEAVDGVRGVVINFKLRDRDAPADGKLRLDARQLPTLDDESVQWTKVEGGLRDV